MRLLEATASIGNGGVHLVVATVAELRQQAVAAMERAGERGRVTWEVFEYSVTAADVAELRRTGKWSPDLVATWRATTDRGTHRQVRWRRR